MQGFTTWATRVAKSGAHADALVAVNEELKEALMQLGNVASLRAALNTANDWGAPDGDLALQHCPEPGRSGHELAG